MREDGVSEFARGGRVPGDVVYGRGRATPLRLEAFEVLASGPLIDTDRRKSHHHHSQGEAKRTLQQRASQAAHAWNELLGPTTSNKYVYVR